MPPSKRISEISRWDTIKFYALLRQWGRANRNLNLPSTTGDETYQEIVSMGGIAATFILHDLRTGRYLSSKEYAAKPKHLFLLLRKIARADHVLDCHRDEVDAAAGDWIRFGIKNGFIE
jgi:hypothetical protein